jgi:NAD(P)-dependent dehydrogenase (short-subunit alcohol dehydrogenase family)
MPDETPPDPQRSLHGAIAVVTGGGTGMGRELVLQLAAAGTRVAMCDVSASNMAETATLATTEVVRFVADVSDRAAMAAFAAHVGDTLSTPSINLLFNNAGIGGGASFVNDSEASWERTFNICWNGVYNGCRVFLPMLLGSPWGHIVNTSSINGIWAWLGHGGPNTAYASAKFAVRGFTESLITDFAANAPHLRASVVHPGHIGTRIMANSLVVQRPNSPSSIIAAVSEANDLFVASAPLSAGEAASIILDGVQRGDWRIMVGEDAVEIDARVRANPTTVYDTAFADALHADQILTFR